ncbi:MAG: class I SAM-dependent methyltransferase [Acidimicrobiales bacterium]
MTNTPADTSATPSDTSATPTPPSAGQLMWDSRYTDHPWPSEPDPALVELVAPLAPGKALDLGCGPGRNSIWLARHGWEVTGVDASAVGLAQAQQRANDAGVTIDTIQADLLAWEPPSRGFDLVVLANVHLVEPERSRLFAAASDAVAPCGHLFVVGHHLDDLGRTGPPDPERLYTEQRLRHAFPTLSVERLERHQRHVGHGEKPLTDVIVWAERVG